MANRNKGNTESTPGSGGFSGGRESGTGASAQRAMDTSSRGLYETAKDTAGQAVSAATDRAATTLDERKSDLAVGLTSVADSLHQVSGNLSTTSSPNRITDLTARYGDQLAQRIEDLSGYFERKNVREMVRDLESFARRNPAVFIGAAFAAGLLAARFIKSTPPRERDYDRLNTGFRGAGTTDITTSEFGTTGGLGTTNPGTTGGGI